jgi:hypothetical protein
MRRRAHSPAGPRSAQLSPEAPSMLAELVNAVRRVRVFLRRRVYAHTCVCAQGWCQWVGSCID